MNTEERRSQGGWIVWGSGRCDLFRGGGEWRSWRRGALLVITLLGALLLLVSTGVASDNPPTHPGGALDSLHILGPPLTALRAKLVDPRWLVAWLQNPSRLRRHAHMRRFRLTREQTEAVAAYLYTGMPAPEGTVPWQGGDPQVGRGLFVSRGCRGCHAIEPTEESFSPRIPHLAGIGAKVRGDWLFTWLKSPRSYDPDTTMPQLQLTDDDARHLVAFLLSHREGAEAIPTSTPLDPQPAPDVAREAIGHFDCARCHLLNGFRAVAPAMGWTVAPRGCATCHEPSSPREAAPAMDGNPAAAALRDGRRLIAYYNCRGCHRIEGNGGAIAQHLERKTFSPPTLDGEGGRVQPSWLIGYLRQPTVLRLWMQIHMPDYGLSYGEAATLARYFAALAHVPPTDEPYNRAAPAVTARGQRRFAHFKCLQCHPASADAQPAQGIDLDDLSINLLLVKSRLRPSWVRDFLARPKAVVGPETRMPAVFYTTDGTPKVDHPDEDIAAITAYLLQMTAPPAAASEGSKSDGGGDQQPIDWTSQPY
jgi:cytochrome c2